jgi:hypothetical protein
VTLVSYLARAVPVTTYTWLNNQGLRSSDGLDVQYTGRFSLEVRWGLRRRELDVEGVLRPEDVDTYHFEKWDNSSVPNDLAEQQRVLKAVRAALDYMQHNPPTK